VKWLRRGRKQASWLPAGPRRRATSGTSRNSQTWVLVPMASLVPPSARARPIGAWNDRRVGGVQRPRVFRLGASWVSHHVGGCRVRSNHGIPTILVGVLLLWRHRGATIKTAFACAASAPEDVSRLVSCMLGGVRSPAALSNRQHKPAGAQDKVPIRLHGNAGRTFTALKKIGCTPVLPAGARQFSADVHKIHLRVVNVRPAFPCKG